MVELGVLPLDGSQTLSAGFGRDNILIARIIAPASGSSYASIYEYATPSVWRKAWLSENRCDMTATGSAGFAQGTGPNLYFSTTPPLANYLKVVPGRTYYLMIRNLSLSGQPTCPVGWACDAAVKVYPPN